MAVVTVAFEDLDTWLSQQPDNTVNTPYELNITGLTENDLRASNFEGTLGYVLRQHSTKFVDLSSTIFPSDITNLDSVFWFCTSLVKSPALPKGLTSMERMFVNCRSLSIAPVIPKSIKSLEATFMDCQSLTTPPVIPNGIEDLTRTFYECWSLINAPILPESVKKMTSAFGYCTSMEIIPNIPKNVISIAGVAYNCSSLTEITSFEADLETIVNNDKAQDAFSGCTSLTKIGIPSKVAESDDWHIFSLNFGASTVEGKVYDKDGTSHNLPQTQIVKSDLKLPILTDELWFPTGYTDSQIEAIIQKMITYRYGVFNKETIPPDEKTFVLQADNPAHFRSNLPFVKESDVVDTVASGNLHSVTSNAVAGAISTEVSNRNNAITNAINTEVTNRNNAIANANNCSWAEHATGSTWVDGRPIYERTIYIENIVRGTYTYVYNVYFSEIISYSGYAWVGSDKYLIPCRWLGFYPEYPHFKIYNYDLGTAYAIVTFRYVK